MRIYKRFKETNRVTLYKGDCSNLLSRIPTESVDLIITSPPYCIGKAYEDPHDDIETFKNQHNVIFNDLYRILKPGGSICWQVGYHVSNKCVIPLDYIIYEMFTDRSKDLEYPLILRNRIIWTFGHGLNSTKNLAEGMKQYYGLQKAIDLIFSLIKFVYLKNILGSVHIKVQTKEN